LLPTVFFFLDPDPDPEAGHSGLCGKQHSSLGGSGHWKMQLTKSRGAKIPFLHIYKTCHEAVTRVQQRPGGWTTRPWVN
jgi:hypothetical protein